MAHAQPAELPWESDIGPTLAALLSDIPLGISAAQLRHRAASTPALAQLLAHVDPGIEWPLQSSDHLMYIVRHPQFVTMSLKCSLHPSKV